MILRGFVFKIIFLSFQCFAISTSKELGLIERNGMQSYRLGTDVIIACLITTNLKPSFRYSYTEREL